MSIQLGDRVKDRITGLKGITVGVTLLPPYCTLPPQYTNGNCYRPKEKGIMPLTHRIIRLISIPSSLRTCYIPRPEIVLDDGDLAPSRPCNKHSGGPHDLEKTAPYNRPSSLPGDTVGL
jgi:hypothetical protein